MRKIKEQKEWTGNRIMSSRHTSTCELLVMCFLFLSLVLRACVCEFLFHFYNTEQQKVNTCVRG